MNMLDAEIVLPSGKFAAIRKPTFGDFLDASAANTNAPGQPAFALVVRCATLDGVTLTAEEWLQQPAEDVLQVLHCVTRLLGVRMPTP